MNEHRMLGLLKRNTKSLPGLNVHTHVDYTSEIWSGQSINQMRDIEGIQRRVTTYILGIPKLSVNYKLDS